jgi:osmotically-inducible protein OsmY
VSGADAAARLSDGSGDALSQEQAMTNTHPRLDSDIFADARKALDENPGVPQDVRVHVDRGTVTLTGTVRWPREKSEAETVVRQIVGVLGVVNHITVAQVVNPEGFEAPESR